MSSKRSIDRLFAPSRQTPCSACPGPVDEEPGLVPARGGYRAWSCRERAHTGERRTQPHPPSEWIGPRGGPEAAGDETSRSGRHVGMSRAAPAQASGHATSAPTELAAVRPQAAISVLVKASRIGRSASHPAPRGAAHVSCPLLLHVLGALHEPPPAVFICRVLCGHSATLSVVH